LDYKKSIHCGKEGTKMMLVHSFIHSPDRSIACVYYWSADKKYSPYQLKVQLGGTSQEILAVGKGPGSGEHRVKEASKKATSKTVGNTFQGSGLTSAHE
jgi:hypothetical protein